MQKIFAGTIFFSIFITFVFVNCKSDIDITVIDEKPIFKIDTLLLVNKIKKIYPVLNINMIYRKKIIDRSPMISFFIIDSNVNKISFKDKDSLELAGKKIASLIKESLVDSSKYEKYYVTFKYEPKRDNWKNMLAWSFKFGHIYKSDELK